METRTHLKISPDLVGVPLELRPGLAVAQLRTLPEMGADDRGLIHGGFTFALADYAAMLAVNDPLVVLGAAEVKFLAPVRLGEVMMARAEVFEEKGKKRLVRCKVETHCLVFEGVFTCIVPEKHVLDGL